MRSRWPAARGARLVRLQCYEGLSAHHALYEWDYARQLLEIRMAEASGTSRDELESRIFDTRFLLRRPLLEAIWPYDDRPVLLLVDEVDRADEEFEALLLEVLSQFQVTIPEVGTVTATRRPTIVLTANRTRALSDALRRRCLYHWIPFPPLDREIEIVQRRLPEAAERLTRHACMFVQALRAGHYRKAPGVSETIDWMRAMTAMGTQELTAAGVEQTLGCLLKDAGRRPAVRREGLRTRAERARPTRAERGRLRCRRLAPRSPHTPSWCWPAGTGCGVPAIRYTTYRFSPGCCARRASRSRWSPCSPRPGRWTSWAWSVAATSGPGSGPV